MTNEEAIARLKVLTDYEYDENLEALDMAIKALEQKPCEDLINQRATTCRHGGHCEWVACDKCNHYEPDPLSQQPCDDCIRREEALMALTGDVTDCTVEEYIARLREKLSKLPSVTPKEKTGWIPVSERLPEPNTLVLCYVTTGATETYFLALWNGIQNAWEEGIGGYRFLEYDLEYEVIAWMPLPEPYKAESEVNE